MKKALFVSAICSSLLLGQSIDLGEIKVEENTISKEVKNVSGEELKSADLAEALSKNLPNVSMVRRSGIANDIIVRGAKKDNINVMIDDAKVCGACPNRMDPPTSHVLTNSVEDVEVLEGPYEVENFGSLAGTVKIKTKKPPKEFSGDANVNIGSFGYKKGSITGGGGNEYVRFLLGASTEEGDQYEDGDGKTLSEQLDASIAGGVGVAGNGYQAQYKDMKAFEKKTVMTKLFINPTDNQELRLGYTLNRSDDILYPSSPMDAEYDDSDIYTIGYSLFGTSKLSKEFNIEAYSSEVDHPMSTKYRQSAKTSDMYRTNHLQTEIKGLKIKNSFDLLSGILTLGIDGSDRNWDGDFYDKNNTTGKEMRRWTSMPDVTTENRAIFGEYSKDIEKINIKVGARFDDTVVKADDNLSTYAYSTLAAFNSATKTENDYKSLSANILATYNVDKNLKYFIGFGKSSRVPDAKELYWANKGERLTADLDQTTNYQTDIGFALKNSTYGANGKVFYSIQKDHIDYNSSRYVNNDATIYGIELGGYYDLNDNFTLNSALAYLRGQKDEALAGQSDKDLAEIPPLKVTTTLTYTLDKHTLDTTMINSAKWSKYDSDNGEQEVDSYSVFNTKYNYKINKNFDVTLGVDNIFDKTYAVSNTYKDLTLISGGGDVMQLNEPGRYVYTNGRFRF